MSIIAISGRKQSGKDTVGRIIQYLTDDTVNKTIYPTFEEFDKLDVGNSGYHPWQVKKFADKLKDIVCLILGCTREQLEDETFKNTPLGDNWNTTFYKIVDASGGFLEKTTDLEEAKKALRYWNDSLSETPELEEVNQVMTPRLMLQLIGTEGGRQLIHPDIWVNSTLNGYNKDSKWIITDCRFENEANSVKEKGGIVIRVNSKRCNNEDLHASETGLDNYNDFSYVIDNDGTIEELVEQIKTILIKETLI